MKKLFSNIRNQLIIGISLIVLVLTFLIATLFLTQYKNLTLEQAENELEATAMEFIQVGEVLINPAQQRPRRIYIEAMRNLSNAEVWIIELNNNVLLDTTEKIDQELVQRIVSEYQEQITKQTTYQYSDYFDQKTMSVIKPIMQENQIVGLVIVHKDVDEIYNAYTAFSILVYLSLLLAVICSIILAIFYASIFTKPLKIIIKTAEQLKKGNYKAKTNIVREDEIGELAETIDTMSFEIDKNITEIKELEQLAKELVSNVSHEFKTPLTLIKGYTINMRDKKIKPQKATYDKIINNTEILENLVNNLLEINRYQSGKVELEKEKIDLVNLVNEVILDMQTIANQKKITINLEVKNKPIINADYFKIKQLLIIFIDNAIKYSSEKKEIKIFIQKNKIEIIDFGVGIEETNLEKIFNQYYKINNEETGYGLGLFIAKHIIELHQYQLKIKSQKGKGTKIEINF